MEVIIRVCIVYHHSKSMKEIRFVRLEATVHPASYMTWIRSLTKRVYETVLHPPSCDVCQVGSQSIHDE